MSLEKDIDNDDISNSFVPKYSNLDCIKYLDCKSKPLVYVKKSLKNNAGNGIFALENIPKGKPVIIYYGDLLSTSDIFEEYTNNKINYINNIAPFLRATRIVDSQGKGLQVNGKWSENINNINLKGYLVNDYQNIDELNEDKMKKYMQSQSQNNVIIVETEDYPIYYTLRDVNKDEELYAHYGLPYWLLHNNCNAEDIRSICENTVLSYN